MYYLVIEEINRGNAPAIFGEVFQLLDRLDDGTSEYAITNDVIANEVYGNKAHPIKIPSNLSILACMLAKVVHFSIKEYAVFSPIPFTPGILSDESPINDFISTT